MLITTNTQTTEMSNSEQNAWLHFLSGDPMFKNFVNNQMMAGENPYQRVGSQPICPKCERPGFHHHDGMVCTTCGYNGPVLLKTRTYLKEGWWK